VPPMSIREYSRTRSADRNSVRHAISTGLIVVDDDGRIADPAQADRDWGSIRRAAYVRSPTRTARQDNEAAARAAEAKIAVTQAKLRLLKQRLDTEREKYVDRAEAIEVGRFEARYVINSLKAAPAGYADKLAAEMAIDPEVARRILERFMTSVLVEIGDLEQAAVRDAQRA
jgi:hypothetical protein